MKKSLVTLLFLITAIRLGFTQDSKKITFSINGPIKYSHEKTDRKVGFEIGYIYSHALKSKVQFETGLSIDMWARFNKKINPYSFDLNYRQSKRNFNLGFDIPFLLSLHFDKLNLVNGVSLYLKNAVKLHSEYLAQTDPEIDTNHNYTTEKHYLDDYQRIYGVSYQFRISYPLLKGIDTFVDFKTSILSSLSGNRYGLVNLGMIYKIASH